MMLKEKPLHTVSMRCQTDVPTAASGFLEEDVQGRDSWDAGRAPTGSQASVLLQALWWR